MPDPKVIGAQIKALRKQRNLSQSRLAEELGVSFQAVSNWERGAAPPDLENLVQLASCFGVLVDDLLRPQGDAVYLGIDGGGTKTEFVVINEQGAVLDRVLEPGCNPNDIGFQASFDRISGGIRDVLVRFPRLRSVFCGIAGISAGDQRSRMLELLQQKFPALHLQVQSDPANLFGIDDRFSMAVICGTGSVVYVKQGDTLTRLGGWGYLLDSAGSAYDLGRDALAAALDREDRQEPPTALGTLLLQRLERPRIYDAIPALYGGGKAYIASLAPLVFRAHAQGDSDASAILEKTAARLGQLLEQGIRLCGAAPSAVAGGGIFQQYADVLLPMIHKYTDTEITVCSGPFGWGLPPVCGACRLSLAALAPVPEQFRQNFKSTYEVFLHDHSQN